MSKDQFDVDAALEDDNTPAGLRDWAKNVQAQNKKLADELAGVRTAQRRDVVTGALKTLGVSEKVSTFYPSDAEATPEAIAKWVKEYEGVFTPAQAPGEGQQPSGPTDHNLLQGDLASAMRTIQDATPPSGAPTPTLAERANEIDRLKMTTADDRAKLDDFQRELMEMARVQEAARINSYRRA